MVPKTSGNPLGVSADALDSSKWDSELHASQLSLQEAIDTVKSLTGRGIEEGSGAGVRSGLQENLKSHTPMNFSWGASSTDEKGK